MTNNLFQCITTYHYIIVSIILFIIGLLGVIISKNFIKMLISTEFIINSINLLFIAFASYKAENSYLGYTIVIFSTGISAIIMSVCLYFTNLMYKNFGTIDITKIYDTYKEKE